MDKTEKTSAFDGVKKGLDKAADLTSLTFKLQKAERKRKAAYCRLGELAYVKYLPRPDKVTEENLAAALRRMDPVLKFRPVTGEKCIVACPLRG